MSERTAGCICGAVKLSITGEPTVMAYCHCESCRRWLSAPLHTAALWPTPNVVVTEGADKLKVWKRTEASHRQFCSSCGSAVLSVHPDLGMTDVPAGSITGLDYKPTMHVNYGEKVLSIKDGLPKYKGFGGPGEDLPE